AEPVLAVRAVRQDGVHPGRAGPGGARQRRGRRQGAVEGGRRDPVPDRRMSGPGRRLLLEQVAERTATLPMRVWGFGEGPALSGLVAASDVLGRPDLLERATELVRPSLGAPPGPEDHLIAVEVLRHLADRVPDL